MPLARQSGAPLPLPYASSLAVGRRRMGRDRRHTPAPQPAGAQTIPDHALELRAVLPLAAGEPFTELAETYPASSLLFPPPVSLTHRDRFSL